MFCFFQAEDGIRDRVRSRGLGDVYKRQLLFLRRWSVAVGYAVGVALPLIVFQGGIDLFLWDLSLIHI